MAKLGDLAEFGKTTHSPVICGRKIENAWNNVLFAEVGARSWKTWTSRGTNT